MERFILAKEVMMHSEMIMFFIIGILFIYMVYEDYKYQTVDLVVCAGFFVMSNLYFIASNAMIINYYLNLTVGIVVFIWIYIVSIKISNIANCNFEKGLSFLPSIFLGICIYIIFLFKSNIWICNLDNLFITGGFFYPLYHVNMNSILIVFILIFVYKSMWIIQAKKCNQILNYGFADGDVIMCSLLTGLFGWMSFSFIFTISIAVHIFLTIIFYKIKKFGG